MIPNGEITDLIVTTRDPGLLDETIQGLPSCAAVVLDNSFDGKTARIRVFSGLRFLRFALENQGYATILREEQFPQATS